MKMREDDSNWLWKWEDELPSPEELMPLSQTLITPHLALAFDIPTPNTPISLCQLSPHFFQHQQTPPPLLNSSEFDSSSAEFAGGSASDEPARTLKRPRLVWTPQLHKRFVDAVAHLGIKKAVPKTIMQLMSVDGLTRENVASHLQKYRLYLKRMQGLSNGGGGSGSGSGGSGDPVTDHLFASGPLPAHFLHQMGPGGGRPNSDHFMPYVGPAVAALHHQQMAAVGVVRPPANQIQTQYSHHHHLHNHHPRQMGHPYLSTQAQVQAQLGSNRNSGYVEDVESGTAINGGRKALTLFPTGDD